jgi:hypothetical protein
MLVADRGSLGGRDRTASTASLGFDRERRGSVAGVNTKRVGLGGLGLSHSSGNRSRAASRDMRSPLGDRSPAQARRVSRSRMSTVSDADMYDGDDTVPERLYCVYCASGAESKP